MAEEKVKLFLEAKMPGESTFKLNTFEGVERLSGLFEYNLVLTNQNREIDFNTLIGQSATVSVSVGSLTRTYNGIIGKFEQDDTAFKPLNMWSVYRATLYPKLWLLNFSGQCRIFQNKSPVDIIKSILEQSQIKFTSQVTICGMQPREYCVQYNETDLNFVLRLMEEEGIFYYFQQSQEGHTLVLGDTVEDHPQCPNVETASFHDAAVHNQMMLKVSSCFIKQRIVTKSATVKSYNYLTPQTPLKAVSQGKENAGGGEMTSYHEIYDQQERGDALVKLRLEADELPQKMVEGVSTIPFFLPGYRFKLDNHPRTDANLEYVLYEVRHEARLVEEGPEKQLYKNTYLGFPVTTPFRPPRKTFKPRIYGTQTAVVTGKPEEEIYTEEYGRIKVKFHWDPSETTDENTSCWIRVATLWSGQTWGSLFTPRVGHEVVISFIDGDPDKPLVVGSVYNGQNKPPYLPTEPTKSTIKSQTSKKGEDETPGFNEFRFEDKKGSEEIYIHAQKDFKIDIQNNHDITIVGGNRNIVLQSQEEQQEERPGEQSNDSLKLENGNKSLQIVKGNYTIQLDEGNITVTCASGDVSFDVTGNISYKCTGSFSVDAGQTISMKAAESITEEAGADYSAEAGGSATVKAGGDTSVEAGGAVSVKGGGTVSVEGATVEVTGGLITLNG